MGRSCGIVEKRREEYSDVILDYFVRRGVVRKRKCGEMEGMGEKGVEGCEVGLSVNDLCD